MAVEVLWSEFLFANGILHFNPVWISCTSAEAEVLLQVPLLLELL